MMIRSLWRQWSEKWGRTSSLCAFAGVLITVAALSSAHAATLYIQGCENVRVVDATTIACGSVVVPPPPVEPPPPPPPGSCPANTVWQTVAWNSPKFFPNWPGTVPLVLRYDVPLNAPHSASQFFAVHTGEYNAPPTFRQIVLSRTPCDFNRKRDILGNDGPLDTDGGSSSVAIGANLGVGKPFAPGSTWYVSIRNVFYDSGSGTYVSSCDHRPTCQMVVGPTWPR